MSNERVVHKFWEWKFEGKDATIEVPLGIVVMVAAQYPNEELPTLWIERPIGPYGEPNNIDKQVFVLHGTGHINIEHGEQHVGSCICKGGALVWHVYKRPRK